MNFNIPKFNIITPKVTFKGNKDDNLTNSSRPTHPINTNNNLNPINKVGGLFPKTPDLKPDTFEMSVGYVNDTHGQTNNMMRILSGIRGDLKLSAGDNDIGDEKNQGVHQATTYFLNIADIKASALGNHEIDTTQKDCIDSIERFNGDMLSINYRKDALEDQDDDEIEELGRAELDKHLKKSTVVEVKGEKIGLIGASPMDMMERLTHPKYYADSSIDDLEDTIEEIQDEVDDMKEAGINKIFLLSHLGHKRDQIVAQETEGIDVIIGGHSHELIKDIKEGENLFYSKSQEPVVLTEAGKDGNYFGLLNLTFDKDGVLTKAQNNVAETRLFHKNMINQHIFNKVLGTPEVVGYIKQAPPPPKSLIEENAHANFACDIMREMTNSDIALWHNCGVRNFFHEGEINTSEVKDMAPFLDYVVTANVTEKSIVDLFKHAIEATYKTPGYKPGLIAVSGLNYTVNPNKGTLEAMNFIDKNGQVHNIDINNPSEDKKYRVVTDEFLMSAGADFDVLVSKEDWTEKFPYDKDYLISEYLRQHKEPVVINHFGRINYIEEN